MTTKALLKLKLQQRKLTLTRELVENPPGDLHQELKLCYNDLKQRTRIFQLLIG